MSAEKYDFTYAVLYNMCEIKSEQEVIEAGYRFRLDGIDNYLSPLFSYSLVAVQSLPIACYKLFKKYPWPGAGRVTAVLQGLYSLPHE